MAPMRILNALRFLLCLSGLGLGLTQLSAETRVELPSQAVPRVRFGAERLVQALESVGEKASVVEARENVPTPGESARRVVLEIENTPAKSASEEQFSLNSGADGVLHVHGGGASGVLYGCLELARRVQAAGRLPERIEFADAPALKLRGTCIGMQKTYILPGRHVYEYPYTPELFPFFYDKAFWTRYLDFLAANRLNTLYLWNGHPFASLVRLKDYPYAMEVPEDVFRRNVEMFRYLTEEADKRGIWVVQMFYNIILSKPFAERHGLPTQLAASNPIAADYTRKSIAEFVRQYPNVGLLVCLGEALQDLPQQTSWCTDVILPGVKDGMREAGLSSEPPVIIRAHATDERTVMPAALEVYGNLYTMAKYNGESLTTWEPRGVWQERQQAMGKLGSMHVVNVHILADLEPFRYGATEFIRKSVLAIRGRLGGSGLHLYPLAYWNWPYSPDAVEPSLEQIDRDWIWFEAWARYAWNPDVDPAEDREYWVRRLAERYGSPEAAKQILAAYNDAGECAPRLLRRFGITEGNRQTLSLGMTLDQLVDPKRYRAYPELWLSQAPPGERLDEFSEKEWKHEPHVGETPVSIVDEVLAFSQRAIGEIDAAAPAVSRNRDEFERLRNDVRCVRALSLNYAEKVRAALAVLRFRLSGDPRDLAAAEPHLAQSLVHYRELAKLTDKTYRFANTMQTSQRRIPVTGAVDGKPANYHWVQLLPVYEKELADFRARLKDVQSKGGALRVPARHGWIPVAFSVVGGEARTYTPGVGASVFTDAPLTIQSLAPELSELTAVRFPRANGAAGDPPVVLDLSAPAVVLVGFAHTPAPGWRRVPELETDALAGERMGTEALLENAATVDEVGAIDVYGYRLPAGRQTLDLRGSGAFVVLGVVAQAPTAAPHEKP
ncbi:hypothetical protein DB347_09245 [Opitutaceae bacterium EW11]|nr:hypothetical protein DB347_09245 [Opitutaceae bacterium EW11]